MQFDLTLQIDGMPMWQDRMEMVALLSCSHLKISFVRYANTAVFDCIFTGPEDDDLEWYSAHTHTIFESIKI